MTDPFAFAGLVKSHYGSHRPRMAEPAGNIDRRYVGERDNQPDSRHRHQSLADFIMLRPLENLLVQFGELFAQLAPCSKQRLHDFRQIGVRLNEFAYSFLESAPRDLADLQPEIAQEPTHIVLESDRLFLQQRASRQQGAATPKNEPAFVAQLLVKKFHGVGPATAEKMRRLGVDAFDGGKALAKFQLRIVDGVICASAATSCRPS